MSGQSGQEESSGRACQASRNLSGQSGHVGPEAVACSVALPTRLDILTRSCDATSLQIGPEDLLERGKAQLVGPPTSGHPADWVLR